MLKYAVSWNADYTDQFWGRNNRQVPNDILNKLRNMGISENGSARDVLVGIINYARNYMEQHPYIERYTIAEFVNEFGDIFPAESFGPPSRWDVEQGYNRLYRPLQSILSHDPEFREIWDTIGFEKRVVQPGPRGGIGPGSRDDLGEGEDVIDAGERPIFTPRVPITLGYKLPKGFVLEVELEGNVSAMEKYVKVYNTVDFNNLINKIKNNKLIVKKITILSPDYIPGLESKFNDPVFQEKLKKDPRKNEKMVAYLRFKDINDQINKESIQLSMIFNGAEVRDSGYRIIKNEVPLEDINAITDLAKEGADPKDILEIADNIDKDTAKTIVDLYGPGKLALYAKSFCKLANDLDKKGLTKYANILDKATITIYNTIEGWIRK